jgi:hypothetical protein
MILYDRLILERKLVLQPKLSLGGWLPSDMEHGAAWA